MLLLVARENKSSLQFILEMKNFIGFYMTQHIVSVRTPTAVIGGDIAEKLLKFGESITIQSAFTSLL